MGNETPPSASLAGTPAPAEHTMMSESLFEAVADALLLIDSGTGQILAVNAAAEALYGYSRAELLRLAHTALSAEPAETRRAAVAGETRIPLRYHRRRDGTVFPVEITARHLAWRGRPAHLAAIRDCTERRAAEEMLQRQADLLELAEDGIFVVDWASNRITYWNRSAADRYGWSAAEAVGQDPQTLLRTELPLPAATIRARLCEAGRWDGEVTHVSRCGTRLLEVTRWALQRDAAGAPLAILQINDDLTARRAAEAALRQAHERMQATFASLPDALLVLDTAARVVDCNRGAAAMFGVSRESLLGQPTESLHVDAAALATFRAALGTAVARNGFLDGYEFQMRRHTGEIFPTEHTVIPLTDAQGRPAGWVSRVRDITERRRAAAALEGETRRRQALFEQSPDGILIFDPATARFLEFNTAAHRQLGYTREEFARLGIPDVEALETAAETQAHIAAVLRGGSADFETVQRTRQGELRHVHVTAQLLDVQGQPVYHCVWRDITARKRAEAAAATAHARLQAVLDAVPVCIYVKDTAGRFTLANAAQARALGQTEVAAILGKTDADFFPAALAARYTADERRVLETGTPLRDVEEPSVEPTTGASRWDLTSKLPLVDAAGAVTGLVGVSQDITTRKAAEARLREAHQTLEAVLGHTYMMAVLLDPQFNFVWVNPAYAATCGHPPEFFPGKNHFALYPHAENQVIFQRVVETGESHFVAARPFAFPDQPERGVTYWDWSLIPVKEPAGAVIGLVFTLAEVTARIRAEAALQASEAHLRALIDTTPMGILTLQGRRCTFANAAAERLLGYGPGDLVGREALEVIHPDARALAQEWLAGIQAGASTAPGELLGCRRDGATFIAEVRSAPVTLAGRPGALVLFQDITDRKQAEEALRARTAQLEALQTIGAEITRELDLPTLLRRILRAAMELVGDCCSGAVHLYDEAEGVLRPAVWEGLPTEWDRLVRLRPGEGMAGSVFATGRGLILNEYRAWTQAVPAVFAHTPIGAILGEPLLYQGQARGVINVDRATGAPGFTAAEAEILRLFAAQAAIAIENAQLYAKLKTSYEELQQAQAEMIRSEQLRGLGQMAAGIAHDLNNTLATVLGQVEIARHALVPPDLQEVLDAIETAASDGAATVKRIQDFARPRGSSPLAPCGLAPLVLEAVEITRPRWQAEPQRRGVRIAVTCDLPDLPPILGYPPEIREALTNLIFNAVDAMPTGGTLCFQATAATDTVSLTVADTGIGMPAEVQAKAFEPFFTTKGVQGTGLGLAVVYGILERHGGRIAVASTPGRGTTLTLTFQRAQEAAAPAAPASAADHTVARRILVVDDEAGVRRTLSRLLRLAGHSAVEAADGAAALEALGDTSVDLVITDLGMPGMSGWELARQIKADRPGLPVILLTGWQDPSPEAVGDRTTVDVVLGKPVKLPDLLQAIERVG